MSTQNVCDLKGKSVKNTLDLGGVIPERVQLLQANAHGILAQTLTVFCEIGNDGSAGFAIHQPVAGALLVGLVPKADTLGFKDQNDAIPVVVVNTNSFQKMLPP